MIINILENKKIAILGFGKTGSEVYKVLQNDYNDILLIDDNNDNCLTTDEALKFIDDIDVIIKSPGIDYQNELLQSFKGLVLNDIELAYLYIKEQRLDIEIIGITATNGKTTTVMMINDILNKFNYNSFACGNIGVSPLVILNSERSIDYLVMELSSFQLYKIKYFKCDYAMFINISQDHLSYHRTMLNYYMSKLNIINNMKEGTFVVGRSVLEFYRVNSDKIDSDVLKDYNIDDEEIKFNNLHIHEENAILSYQLLQKIGLSKEEVFKLINKFNGIDHRMESVISKFPFDIINDSKATNIHATNSAIISMVKPTNLIIGGAYKEEDYTLLDYKNENIKNIIICGDNQKNFNFIEDAIFVVTLKDAIETALEIATEGEVILLSPASASFDEFENFEQRGNFFKDYIKEKQNAIYN